MSEITKEKVQHIAKLARLSLTDDELTRFTNELSGIINYVEQLQELDTKGVEPMIGAIEQIKPLREDIKEDSQLRDLMLANAPQVEESAVKIPKMS